MMLWYVGSVQMEFTRGDALDITNIEHYRGAKYDVLTRSSF
jgi:hypothetical protein